MADDLNNSGSIAAEANAPSQSIIESTPGNYSDSQIVKHMGNTEMLITSRDPFEQQDDSTATKFENALTKGAPLALASGAYSLYNSTLGLITGQEDLSDDLHKYNSAWASYYDENKGAIDLAGDLAGLAVPGTLGLKFLKAAKSANTVLGAMPFVRSLGAIDRAAAQFGREAVVAGVNQAQADGFISAAWKTRGRAAAGALQDSAVITAFSYATMNKSQMFDDYSVGRFFEDTLFGAGLAGIPGVIKQSFAISRGINDYASGLTALSYIKGNNAGTPLWAKMWGRLSDSELAQDSKIAQKARDQVPIFASDLIPANQKELQRNLGPFLQNMSSNDFSRDFAGATSITQANVGLDDISNGAGIKRFLMDRNLIQPSFTNIQKGAKASIFVPLKAGDEDLTKADLIGQEVFTNPDDAKLALSAGGRIQEIQVSQRHLFDSNPSQETLDAAKAGGIDLSPSSTIYAPTNEAFEKGKLLGTGAADLAQAIKDKIIPAATPYYHINLLTGNRAESIVQTAGDKGVQLISPEMFRIGDEVHSYNKFEGFFDVEDPAVADGMFLLGMRRAESPNYYFKIPDGVKQAYTAANPTAEIPKYAVADTDLLGLQGILAHNKGENINILEGGPTGTLKQKTPSQVQDIIGSLKDTLFKTGQEKGLSLDDLQVRLNMDTQKWVTGDKSAGILYRDGKQAQAYAAPTNATVHLNTGDLPTREDYLASLDRRAIQESQRVATISHLAPAFDDLIPHENFVNGYTAKDFFPRPGFAGTFTFGSTSTTGEAAGFFERVGTMKQDALLKYSTQQQGTLLPVFQQLQRNPNALFEFNNLVNTFRSLPAEWKVVDDINGFGKLQNIRTGEFYKDSRLQNMDLRITPTVKNAHDAFQSVNQDFITRDTAVAKARGEAVRVSGDADYYPPPDVRNREFFAYLRGKDGQMTAITAGSANDLRAQASALKDYFGDAVDVIYKDDIKTYKKQFGDFDPDQFFKSYELDTAMRRSGKLTQMAPPTNDIILKDLLAYSDKQSNNVLNRGISTYMAREFEELNFLGQEYAEAANSRRGFSALQKIKADNPYQDYINTALNKSGLSSSPVLESINNAFSTTVNKAFDMVKGLKSAALPDSAIEVEQGIQNIQQRYGVKFNYADPDLVAPINKTYSKDVASNIVSRFNGVMTKLTLSLDGLFHAVNVLSGPLLLAPELQNLKRNLTNGVLQKAVQDLTSVQIPGTTINYPSTMKVMSKSLMKLFDPNDSSLAGYSERGLIDADVLQYRETQMQMAVLLANPSKTALGKGISGVNNTLNQAAGFADRWVTQPVNKMLQYFAVDAAHQYLDAAGITDTALKDSVASMISKRTVGNYTSGQRPIIFSGPVGHALGLFQTFMFAVGQNLTRYIADGDKAALTTFGLMQTGLFGAQSNPVFQALNYHIGKQNADRKDLYSAAYNYGSVGDWLLYGIPSNALNLSLYTRGDLTPNNPMIIPTSLDQIPIVSAAMKMGKTIAQLYNVVKDGGGNGDTFLHALAQNGLNRPLAGMAQLADGRSQMSNGDTINDSIRDWTAWTRVLGGKPFDEQKVLDSYYRQKYYEAYDIQNLKTLGTAIKSTVANGGEPSDDQVKNFLSSYIQSGGNARNFQRYWTQQVIQARTPIADRLYSKMAEDPKFAEYRSILAGTSIRNADGSNLGEPSITGTGNSFGAAN